jgi:hypothetical protein
MVDEAEKGSSVAACVLSGYKYIPDGTRHNHLAVLTQPHFRCSSSVVVDVTILLSHDALVLPIPRCVLAA